MSSPAAGRATHLPIASTGALQELVREAAQWFRVAVPMEAGRVAHLWWLAALTLAGAGVRFWGLGDVSLHGDEETMAMAVRHILIDGRPILPSGMFYPRGLTQLYLMAVSVSLFGESEWALRLPSALCGTALIGLSYAAAVRSGRAR